MDSHDDHYAPYQQSQETQWNPSQPAVLGGYFFFKRGHATRGNARALFTIIAYRLALNIDWLQTRISQVVHPSHSIVVQSIATQMKTLISGLCFAHTNREFVTLLIDGLDECKGHDIKQEILRPIRASSSNHRIPFRFIISGHPEPHIRETFDSPAYAGNHSSFNVE
ncbi:hypothetical protein C8R45DRAFT_1214990 [Mycena sanguinolenta]|nr:hypothetical protein C8R45DRAFT_1214990 [Mycena sanguinolenta]